MQREKLKGDTPKHHSYLCHMILFSFFAKISSMNMSLAFKTIDFYSLIFLKKDCIKFPFSPLERGTASSHKAVSGFLDNAKDKKEFPLELILPSCNN